MKPHPKFKINPLIRAEIFVNFDKNLLIISHIEKSQSPKKKEVDVGQQPKLLNVTHNCIMPYTKFEMYPFIWS